MEAVVEKKKRGRKSKLELENIYKKSLENVVPENLIIEAKIPKKRGRKPKGGKIIDIIPKKDYNPHFEQNVILHLKCKLEDIDKMETETIENYKFNDNKLDLTYQFLSKSQHNVNDDTNAFIPSDKDNINENNTMSNSNTMSNMNKCQDCCNIINNNSMNNNSMNNIMNTNINTSNKNECLKNIWKKVETLAINLHNNNIPDKKSACFWCTYTFDNPPIFIPKYEINNSYYVYGCFCSLECACAHLIAENIDNASKFERYYLLNFIYGKIYNYERNIEPAPNPFYTLDKYYGNLSIQEYRKLFKSERLLLVVDKPLSRILPELHEDNNDCLLSNNAIPTSNNFKIKKNKSSKKETIFTA